VNPATLTDTLKAVPDAVIVPLVGVTWSHDEFEEAVKATVPVFSEAKRLCAAGALEPI
jgi:hypothetical protein